LEQKSYIKKWRVCVDSWTESTIFAHSLPLPGEASAATALEALFQRFSDEGSISIANPQLLPTVYLWQGAILNLLLSEPQADGSYLPQHIVLDPDYLVDVTSICHCFTRHGDAPAMHLLSKFLPVVTTSAIMLGNVANQFLDDCLNHQEVSDSEQLYKQSLTKAFCSDPLRFVTTSGIGQEFSNLCRSQFENIRSVVTAQFHSGGTLEAAFICEALGIQGRMDFLSDDHRNIVELKSGKADEFSGNSQANQSSGGKSLKYRYEHAMQMALYKESLYYNEGLVYAEVNTHLLYSRYPELMNIHLGRADIHRAIDVRNSIVHLEHLLRSKPALLLDILSEQHFNPSGVSDRFYEQFSRPSILLFLNQLRAADKLSRTYFDTMLAFVEREQWLAKTGVEGITLSPGHQGFADTWRADSTAKCDNGRLIPSLTLTPIRDGELIVALDATTTAIDESSNFRIGDMVMLYPQDSGAAQPASSYVSCIIEGIHAEGLRLRLRYPQHDLTLFRNSRLFAIEPAHADAGFTTLYRGLFAMLGAPRRRVQLLLGQRQAEFDTTIGLNLDIADETLRGIILHAKQARDYYLLVGPPGSGKTSIALRQMVQEFLSGNRPQNLLLMAFTNRAVDEICAMLNGISADYLRLGPSLSCAAEHRAHLLSTNAEEKPSRAVLRERLQTVPIVVGTIASLSSSLELFTLRKFDTAIIDEASQALEPHLLPLICATTTDGCVAIDKFILIGDHKQLPAVVAQPVSSSRVADPCLVAIDLTDCRRSLFERLHTLSLKQGLTQAVGTLERQGRMHEDISKYVSAKYYEGRLAPVPLPHQIADANGIYGGLRMLAVDVVPELSRCSAKSNGSEATVVAKIVKAIKSTLDAGKNIGVIVPFRGQITMIRRAFEALAIEGHESINIDTVERYQGSQRDVIIFSTTVSSSKQLNVLSQPVEMADGDCNGTPLLLDRKLNVAITRAREQFILVGNLGLLSQSPPYADLLTYMQNIQTGIAHYSSN